MKDKILVILSFIFIAMSITGFTYAQWNDTIVIRNTMTFGYWNDTLSMGFVEPLNCVDNEVTENVGECNCHYADYKIDNRTGMDGYNTTIMIINNGYPGYEVHCNLTLQNIGTLALHINRTVISDPTSVLTWNATLSALVDTGGKPILNINMTALECKELASGETLKVQIRVGMTQNTEQCHTYRFQVRIVYEEA